MKDERYLENGLKTLILIVDKILLKSGATILMRLPESSNSFPSLQQGDANYTEFIIFIEL